MSSVIALYIPCKDKTQARVIARSLLAEKLVACANIIGPVESHYEWKGKLCIEKEFVLIAKTRRPLFRKAETLIRRLHSYECPCIVALPVTIGNADFLTWVRMQTTR